MIQEVNKNNFDQEVLKSEKPVMVDFWRKTCSQCLALMPAVEKMAEKYANDIKVVKMNLEGNLLFCAQFQMMALPTFIFFKNGKEAKRLSGGLMTRHDIEKTIKEIL